MIQQMFALYEFEQVHFRRYLRNVYIKGVTMAINIISSKDLYNIVKKTLEIMSKEIMKHGEITGYILYKMLQTEGRHSELELAEYSMIGMMHDIGVIKTGHNGGLVSVETKNVWAHSIYGYLFLRYLSPVSDKANIVLYHHLPYKLHSDIKNDYWRITEYLTVADKMDVYMRMKGHGMEQDYFVKNADVTFSSAALKLFNAAQAKYNILEKLKTGEYEAEMEELFSNACFSEKYKKGFLEMLIYAIDFRSHQTVVHSLATTTFAVNIARLMRVPTEDLQIVYYGALLHDIGKIAIPLEILEAPRRLNDEEMRIMKAHVMITESILRGIIDDRVLEVAIRHHEKLDGSGYHRGLNGKELNTLQRIVAVADILSALYGKRSYKEAFDVQKIKDLMQEDADSGKICPKITGVVISNMQRILSNFEKQRDETIGVYETILDQYEIIYKNFKQFE